MLVTGKCQMPFSIGNLVSAGFGIHWALEGMLELTYLQWLTIHNLSLTLPLCKGSWRHPDSVSSQHNPGPMYS